MAPLPMSHVFLGQHSSVVLHPPSEMNQSLVNFDPEISGGSYKSNDPMEGDFIKSGLSLQTRSRGWSFGEMKSDKISRQRILWTWYFRDVIRQLCQSNHHQVLITKNICQFYFFGEFISKTIPTELYWHCSSSEIECRTNIKTTQNSAHSVHAIEL